MFERVEAETHFPLIGQVLIFRRSLINFFIEVFCRAQLKKGEVSSANNLRLEDKSSDTSLIYIKKNSEPRILEQYVTLMSATTVSYTRKYFGTVNEKLRFEYAS